MLGALGHALTASRVAVSPWIFQWVVEGRFGLAASALLAGDSV